jgi:hypothetical protein
MLIAWLATECAVIVPDRLGFNGVLFWSAVFAS